MLTRGRYIFQGSILYAHRSCASSKLLSPSNFYEQNPAICYCHQSRQKSHKQRQKSYWPILSFGGLLAGFITFKFYSKENFTAFAAALDAKTPFLESNTRRPSGSSKRGSFNFVADVVDIVGSAVVYIERLGKIPFINQTVPISNGSGFIVDKNGLIITNAHVVGNQSNLMVKLPDGREFKGQVVGIDEARDIAAVKIDGKNLPSISLGSTADLRPGEWVVAIGSPLALKNTVTAGIVSNLCRPGKELGLHDRERRDMEYIQTDATITVGNSGGPLVNLDGEVIGINTMMASAGIGFAIPIDYAKEFLKNVKPGQSKSSYRTPNRRWIGITMLSLTPDIAMQLRSRNPDFPNISEGVYVHRVHYDTPAYLSGMQDGDVITAINDVAVKNTKDVMDAVMRKQVLHVTVRRGARNIELRIVAEEIVH